MRCRAPTCSKGRPRTKTFAGKSYWKLPKSVSRRSTNDWIWSIRSQPPNCIRMTSAAGVGARWSWQRKREGDRMGLELISETPDTVVFRITGSSPAQPTLKYSIAPGMVAAEFEGRLELLGKAVSIVKSPEAVIAPSLERELKLLAKQVGSP